MNGGTLIMRQVAYVKPNMSNLRGKAGRRIIETIRNTQPTNPEDMRRKAEMYKKNILAIREYEQRNSK